MGLGERLGSWPVWRQLRGPDRLGLREAVTSPATRALSSRTAEVDHVAQSVCPFCAVGCAQRIHVRDGEITHIDGDPASPVSRGRLGARGASSLDLVAGPSRETRVKYRAPHAREWSELDVDTAMDMIADRVIAARDATWQETDADGHRVDRTNGIAALGGAACDNEENYLVKKLWTALGAVQIENQARI
jgi:formate dehydrogenase major subunit